MKKIFLCAGLLALMIASCKKKNENPSITVTASYPIFQMVNNGLFSVPLGGSLPTGAAFGAAYDTFYTTNGQPTPCPITLLNTPAFPDTLVNYNAVGLYAQVAQAQNKYGYVSYDTFFVAVTNFPSAGAPNLAGTWQLSANDSFNTTLSSLGNGYYSTSNLLGANILSGSGTSAVIVALTDSTVAIFFNALYFEAGYSYMGTLSLAPGDTTISYTGVLGNGPITYTKN